MDFPFDVDSVLPQEVTVVDHSTLGRGPQTLASFRKALNNNLQTIVDRMGELSARAQGLRAPVTSAARLITSDHRLYILKMSGDQPGQQALRAKEKSKVAGILKVGCKHLFLSDSIGRTVDTTPVCVLDFYVHESCQRTGYGRRLFDFMLEEEGLQAQQLALDRPSHKFLSFLQKHFHLTQALHQANNYVVFRQFFQPPVSGRGPTNKPETLLPSKQAVMRSVEVQDRSARRDLQQVTGEAGELQEKEEAQRQKSSNNSAADCKSSHSQSVVSAVPHLDLSNLQKEHGMSRGNAGELKASAKGKSKDDDFVSIEVQPRSSIRTTKSKPVSLPPLRLHPLIANDGNDVCQSSSGIKGTQADQPQLVNSDYPKRDVRVAEKDGATKEATLKSLEPLRLGREGRLPLSSRSGLTTKRPTCLSDTASKSNWANQLQLARQRSLQRLAFRDNHRSQNQPKATVLGNPMSDWKRTSWNVFGIPYSHSGK